MARRLLWLVSVALVPALLAACAAGASPSPAPTSPGASASAGPGPGATSTTAGSTGVLSQVRLRIRLIDRFGPLWYCDPDFYPVARDDEAALAVNRWPEVSADAATLGAIVEHLRISPAGGTPTDAQKLAIYREWKVIRAIGLDPAGADRFRFDYLAMPASGGQQGTRTTGTIDARGSITVESSVPASQPNCPICLARGQPVDTPSGPTAVEALRLGDPAWSMDLAGVRIPAVVIALGSTPAPAGHEMVRLLLADGRTLLVSPGHPLADGRLLGGIRVGDWVDGALVAVADRLSYAGTETFDLLTSGPTGRYSVDGIWLGSTLRR